MRRRVEYEPRQTLSGSELRRAMTLLMLLLLVGGLMYRARDPRMWAMFGDDAEQQLRAKDLAERAAIAKTPAQAPRSAPQPTSLVMLDPPTDTAELDDESADAVPPPEYDEPVDEPPSESAPPAPRMNDAPAQRARDGNNPNAAVDPAATQRTELPPLDEDAEERDSLNEEISVVSDNQPMLKEEMAAYYRLFRWANEQTYKQLAAKAIKDPRFGEIFTQPDKFRGKLVDLRLHVRRVLMYDDLEEDNPANLEKIWEIVGYNDSSGHNFYMCITDELPADMPVGPKIMAEGRFAGYFLKLMKYEDGQGKNRAIPVFIGKFEWEPSLLQGPDPEQQVREWVWVMFGGAALGALILARWGWRKLHPGKPTNERTLLGVELARWRNSRRDGDDQGPDLETWLENPESIDSAAINDADDYEDEDEDNSDANDNQTDSR